MIKIGSKRKGDKGVYVGRPSILGNPFTVRDYGHGVAIDMYRTWLESQLLSDTPQYRAIKALAEEYKAKGQLTLVCWCAPKPCHAEVIAKAIEYMLENTND